MKDTQLIDLFQRARVDDSLAVIEGVQALKHAQRFKADIQLYITCDIELLKRLLAELANDVKERIIAETTEVSEGTFNKLSAKSHRTKVIALAKRKEYSLAQIDDRKPIILLEEPRDLENIGAVIRVAAAADAGAVVITGPLDIWHPAIIRGAAGLHWSLPVFDDSVEPSFSGSTRGSSLNLIRNLLDTNTGRPIISLDPTGEGITNTTIPNNSILIFGTERHGISKKLLSKSDQIVRLPMKTGVSSLNLATSVAATLYQL